MISQARPSTPTPPKTPVAVVTALPDVASHPSEHKKVKLNHEPESPIVTAVPLPSDDGPEAPEEWWNLRMSWGGKVYEMRVGGSDM